MEEQMITVNEPRTIMEPVPIQVPVVQTTQAVQMHHKIVEYERPRMIPGRMVRAYAGPTQTVGMTGAQQYGSYAGVTGAQQYGSYAGPMQSFGGAGAQQYGSFVQPSYGYPAGGSAQP